MRVWVEEWHIGDEGAPWRVGDPIAVSVMQAPDRFSADRLLGEPTTPWFDTKMADGFENKRSTVRGTIRRIDEVTARYDRGRPLPGSGRIAEVEAAWGLRGDVDMSQPTPAAYIIDVREE